MTRMRVAPQSRALRRFGHMTLITWRRVQVAMHRTCIVVAHRLSTIQVSELCDSACLLRDGDTGIGKWLRLST